MLVQIMFTKRVILLILGIAVAVVICLSTSLFGMKTADSIKFQRPGSKLESYADLIRITNRNVDWKSVIAEF